jgi:cytochrome d ubiquinol oxidase subunit I
VLFGLPDVAQGRNRFEIAVPHVGSMILTHSWDGLVRGLNAFPKTDWPVVFVVFWSFRVMVGVAMLMFALGLYSLWLRYKGRLYDAPWFHRAAIALSPAGFVCILAGWTTTEVGRQPWTVFGELRTAQSVSPITLPMVAFSCALILVIYTVVFGVGIRYLLAMMANPPTLGEQPPANDPPQRTQGITPGLAGGQGKRRETRPGDTLGVPAE